MRSNRGNWRRYYTIPIEKGLDFILSHFQEFPYPWPRTVSTQTTKGGQVLVNGREEALARFKQANYLDCRISAYDPNGDENPYATQKFMGIRTATPTNIVVIIDIDRCNFKSERALVLALRATLKNIKDKLDVNTPTVIWSGRGYHVLQPLDANGIVLEHIKQFENVHQPSLKFLRFAEWYLSNGKSDQAHNTTVSFRNCMLRIPGTINSKNGQVVRVVHKWDGHRPEINYMLRDFRHWFIDQTLRQEQELRKRRKTRNGIANSNYKSYIIQWIEQLLRTPIRDYRKLAIWHILAPYLLNRRSLSYDESYSIICDWLDKCNEVKRLDFNPHCKIKAALNDSKAFLPIGKEKLKTENDGFYHLLKDNGVLP